MLLSKTLRSSTLKLAYIYVILFCSAIFALLDYAYWSTAAYLYQKSDQLLGVERELLNNAYDRGGRDAVIALIRHRLSDGFFSDWAYLLTDPSYTYVAGNLHAWPTALRNDQGWSDLAAGQEGSEEAKAALRATYGILPDGSHLLVGRNIAEEALAWAAPADNARSFAQATCGWMRPSASILRAAQRGSSGRWQKSRWPSAA